MARQNVIKIKAEIVIPYTKQTFGEASRAEQVALALAADLHKRNDIEVAKWDAAHTSVETGTKG